MKGSMRLIASTITALSVLAASPAGAQRVAGVRQPQQGVPTWEALRARPYPQWFRDAKLGIFIHWGVYSVPAYSGKEQYGEWFLRGLQVGDTLRTRFMRERYGADFDYRDFAPLFRAELFDPSEWADLFRRAGARYVVLVSKHHDGYALWPSAYARGWNSVDVGPRRDLVGELTESVRAAGLRMGLYYSLAEWNNPLHRWDTDPSDSIALYVEQHMIPQFRELIEAYRPTVLFSDGDWSNTAEQWHARELIGWYYDTVGPDAIVNDRWGGGSNIGFLTPEYSAGIEVTDRPWAEVRGLGRSFGLNRNEALDAYMTPAELVHRFVSTVAAGGGMILNVGPGADGQIPLLQQERLVQLGQWLEVNGEAVYGAEPWLRTGEEREVTLERIDEQIDFDWVRNAPGRPIKEDDFAAVWTGYLQPLYSETYTLDARADDGIRVWIDGDLVVDRWERAEGDVGGTVRLEAGRMHTIRVEYYESKQNASARLFWSSPSQPKEIIPRDRLLTTPGPGRDHGLNGLYRSMQQYLAYTQKDGNLYAITFEWPDAELALPISAPQPGTGVRLLGLDRDLPWRYADDTLYVDVSGITFRELPSQWAWAVRLEGY
jgi:alpha-L-fucosidase